jgi:hypothetical protein
MRSAFLADVGRHAFERHDGDRPRRLRDDRLLGRRDVHDDAAFEHLREAALDFLRTFVLHDG